MHLMRGKKKKGKVNIYSTSGALLIKLAAKTISLVLSLYSLQPAENLLVSYIIYALSRALHNTLERTRDVLYRKRLR